MTGSLELENIEVRNFWQTSPYRAGVAVALLSSFLTVWTTIVRDDDTGIGFFLLILAAAVGAYAALFQPAGMARTMLGVAIMQVLNGIALATAPVIARQPDGSFKALVFNLFFAALWLISAAFFRAATKETSVPGPNRTGSPA